MKKLSAILLSLSLIFTYVQPVSFATVQTTKSTQVTAKKSNLDLTKSYKVKSFIDGDTIKINVNNEDILIRLLNVDTPELKQGEKDIPMGKKASEFTSKFLKDKEIKLELDKEHYDKHGRLLAFIYVINDGKKVSLNEELIKEGFAKVIKVGENKSKYDEYKKIEKPVRESKKGIWANIEANYPSTAPTPTEQKEKAQAQKQQTQNNTNITPVNNNATSNSDIQSNNSNTKSTKSNVTKSNVTTNTSTSSQGLIKGNKKSMIYHVPGGASYNKISPKNIVYFDTEEEAQNAGYRKAKN